MLLRNQAFGAGRLRSRSRDAAFAAERDVKNLEQLSAARPGKEEDRAYPVRRAREAPARTAGGRDATQLSR